ncbi:MAG: hypothetical protein K6T33_08050 [Thermomonas hydrothermalis]|uniref:hypothetical protein n=1 Tax=Thermomonas hydrothermalis TaxID=213588 RepID=UPI002356C506|nr:hypothetical protein [Thermomonas hydrothermalis]MCL6619727.1 hypothetical protein [Thermomonas hydrothermalis]
MTLALLLLRKIAPWLLLGVLLLTCTLYLRHQWIRHAGRARQAEQAVARLQAELAQARLGERVVVRYVDRVRILRANAADLHQEIPRHVTTSADAACPVPVGFVRVHDAAAQGVPIDPAAGDPDAPAPGIALSRVAATVADNYGACHETAAQLTALQDWVRGVQAIRTP